MANRPERVKSLIGRYIADIVRNEIRKPGLGIVCVNEVVVANDYSYADVYVTFLDGTTGLMRGRTINVPAIIGFFEVDHDKLRTQAVGLRQQPFGFVEALFKGQQGLLGIVLIIVGILSSDGYIGTGPIDYTHLDALPASRQPDGLAAVERAILARHLVSDAEGAARGYVVKLVGDDAVMVGHQARGQRVVVGERFRGERRAHHRANTATTQGVEKRRVVHLRIVPAEAVERHDDRRMPAGIQAEGDKQEYKQYKLSHDASIKKKEGSKDEGTEKVLS